GRGRPRKNVNVEDVITEKRGRGRPRKNVKSTGKNACTLMHSGKFLYFCEYGKGLPCSHYCGKGENTCKFMQRGFCINPDCVKDKLTALVKDIGKIGFSVEGTEVSYNG
ncbi:MAG: hypothetical protein JW702_09085, partial [Clostridiales bacterium]|nr:hypothetical protein [Clostridiales bacterium]